MLKKISPLLILLLLFLSGCNPGIDPKLLGNKLCTPPCWNGIYPGKTNRLEVLNILNSLEFRKSGKLYTYKDFYINWIDNSGDYSIYFKNDLVHTISMGIESTNVEQAISVLGKPSYLIIEEINVNYSTYLFFPKKGIALIVLGNYGDFEIQPNMLVTTAIFVESGSVDSMISTLYGEDMQQNILSHIIKWVGFGKIKINY